MPHEIVRLAVPEGRHGGDVSYLDPRVNVGQNGLFQGSDSADMMHLPEWESRKSSHKALSSHIGATCREGLTPPLVGAPALEYYETKD